MLKIVQYITWNQCNQVEGMELSQGGKFVFKIRKRLCGLFLIGKIVPEHCNTTLTAALTLCMALELLDPVSIFL